MDYRKFLTKSESMVLPYLGGSTVDAASRRLRVTRPCSPGYVQFDISGRTATPVSRAEVPDFSGLPSCRGHLVGNSLFVSGKDIKRIELLPEEEAQPLSLVRACHWHSGDWLFAGVDFESESEGDARCALELESPLGDVKGVASSLRAAFGFALLARVARELRVPVSFVEARGHLPSIALQGRPLCEEILARLENARRASRMDANLRAIAQRHFVVDSQPAPGTLDRAEAAIRSAGGRVLASRRVDANHVEVTFQFMGERFISIADALTLQVTDAGVCLAGADSEVTLESLPSVIREAIDTDVLVITRR